MKSTQGSFVVNSKQAGKNKPFSGLLFYYKTRFLIKLGNFTAFI